MKTRTQLAALTFSIGLALAGGTATVYSPPAKAITCVTCAQEWTQIMNNVQLVMQYAKQIQQYEAQLTQLANEAKNLTSLPQNIFQQYTQVYQQYAQQLQQMQGLMRDLSSLRDNFRQQYPDLANGNQSFEQLSAFTRQWEQTGRQNIEDALASGASVVNSMQTSQQSFQQMGTASQGATGALDAIQAGNQINMLVGQELMKLNSQTAAFQQAQLQEQARQLGSEQRAQRGLRNAYSDGNAYQRSTAAPAPRIGSQ